MPLLSKNRSVAPLLAVSALGGLMIASCLSSPTEETGVVEEAIEEAPPPRPVPLCQNPEIKDITCSYVGYQTGTLIGAPTLTGGGDDKFATFYYKQDCKFTTAVMADSGGYCAINQIADPDQRVCPPTLDTVITLWVSGGTGGAPVGLATAQADLKHQCESIHRGIFGSAPGKGSCCPKPPPSPILDPIPPLPANHDIPPPLPANHDIPPPLPANPPIPPPLPDNP